MEIIDMNQWKTVLSNELEVRLEKSVSSVRIQEDASLTGEHSIIGVTSGMLFFKIPTEYAQAMKWGGLDPAIFATSIAKWHWLTASAPENSLESLKAFLENFYIGWKAKGEYKKPQTYKKYVSQKPEGWKR